MTDSTEKGSTTTDDDKGQSTTPSSHESSSTSCCDKEVCHISSLSSSSSPSSKINVDENDAASSSSSSATSPISSSFFPFVITPAHVLILASFPLTIGAYLGYRREMKRAANSMEAAGAAAAATKGLVSGAASGAISSTGGDNAARRVAGGTAGGDASYLSSQHSTTAGRMTRETKSCTNKASRGVAAEAAAAAATMGGGAGGGTRISIHPTGPIMAAKALSIGTMLSVGGFGLVAAAAFHATGCQSIPELVSTLREWAPRKRRQFESFFGIHPNNSYDSHPDAKAMKGMSEDEELEYVKRTYMSELYDDDDGDKEKGSK